jgi:hypothetical protein
MVRGNPQQQTHSPAGDVSHGFPAPRPSVGGPDHHVFLPEDKFVNSRQACWADSTWLSLWSVLGVVIRLETKVEAVFVLMTQSAKGGGVKFHS